MAAGMLRRIATGLVLVLAVAVLNFLLIQAAPGDAVDVFVAEGGASEQIVEQVRRDFGLDQPLPVQLWRYLASLAQGDLGYSFHFRQPVLDVILRQLPVTVMLGLGALFVSALAGTALGIVAALRPRHATSHAVTVIALLGYATPTFWLGMMMLMAFAFWLPLFPAYGLSSVPPPRDAWGLALDVAYHLALPVVTLAVLFMASISRLARASMLEVLEADYIRTAQAKGLSRSKVIFKHALRNAAMPIVTMLGLQLGNLLSGAVLVETVFSLPGMGPLLFESVLRRDYPVMLGILLISSLMVIAANILTDLAYRLLDPRIGRRGNAS